MPDANVVADAEGAATCQQAPYFPRRGAHAAPWQTLGRAESTRHPYLWTRTVWVCRACRATVSVHGCGRVPLATPPGTPYCMAIRTLFCARRHQHVSAADDHHRRHHRATVYRCHRGLFLARARAHRGLEETHVRHEDNSLATTHVRAGHNLRTGGWPILTRCGCPGQGARSWAAIHLLLRDVPRVCRATTANG